MYNQLEKQKLCPDTWLPSRLEIECTKGEGMVFTFPRVDCSPLNDGKLELRLQCWATWKEDGQMLTVASLPNEHAQFVIRFDADSLDEDEFTGKLHFSALCRLGRHVSSSNVKQLDLVLRRTLQDRCFDEAEACKEVASAGCQSEQIRDYVKYCKRSCGMCAFLPSTQIECNFAKRYEGQWLLAETDRKEVVTINGGRIKFSSLGEFICKRKHWKSEQYKLLSHYTNGCRARYTFINFLKERGWEILKFRISRSSSVDLSFDKCDFEDDAPPLGDRIRSADFKVILPMEKTRADTCGINGVVALQAVSTGGAVCRGTLSDWNNQTCSSGRRLALHMSGDCAADVVEASHRDYKCDALIELEEGHSLLITSYRTSKRAYRCWVIETHAQMMSYRLWKRVYMLARAQCGYETDFDPISLRTVSPQFAVFKEKVYQPCMMEEKPEIPTKHAPSEHPKHVVTLNQFYQDAPYKTGESTSVATKTSSIAMTFPVCFTIWWLTSCRWRKTVFV